ncbi:hypothetical protein C2845_PM03G07140 [Panicum miliaceum]|uniref:Cathepsin propeptide inhibitor domain-containing protein n=1 Tax=Panicum miliaceum TaxID=4540 RepID=A0A3L6T3Q6_PANMI|nr:hypothetical protein C2845_PM03G07140 [Panicum miliaceum]
MAAQLVAALVLLLPLAGASDHDGFIRQVTDGGSRARPGLLPEAQFAAFVRRHGRRYSGRSSATARAASRRCAWATAPTGSSRTRGGSSEGRTGTTASAAAATSAASTAWSPPPPSRRRRELLSIHRGRAAPTACARKMGES